MNLSNINLCSELEKAITWVCPDCNVASPKDTWEATTVECEDCGSHDAVECPNCNIVFDLIFSEDSIVDKTNEFLENQEKKGI